MRIFVRIRFILGGRVCETSQTVGSMRDDRVGARALLRHRAPFCDSDANERPLKISSKSVLFIVGYKNEAIFRTL